MNRLRCMTVLKIHESKQISNAADGKTAFRGGATSNFKTAQPAMVLAVTAVCATTARTIPTADLA